MVITLFSANRDKDNNKISQKKNENKKLMKVELVKKYRKMKAS